jgi:hypothetical protein
VGESGFTNKSGARKSQIMLIYEIAHEFGKEVAEPHVWRSIIETIVVPKLEIIVWVIAV